MNSSSYSSTAMVTVKMACHHHNQTAQAPAEILLALCVYTDSHQFKHIHIISLAESLFIGAKA